MLDKITKNRAARITLLSAGIVAAVLVAWQIRNLLHRDAVADAANQRIFICSETLQSFKVNTSDLEGVSIPIKSPYSGKETGCPAELCYWTADGHVKTDPTPVLLNSWLGKKGPTFCPDCGRLVVGHNPMAIEGHKPPPTREEWERAHNESPDSNAQQ